MKSVSFRIVLVLSEAFLLAFTLFCTYSIASHAIAATKDKLSENSELIRVFVRDDSGRPIPGAFVLPLPEGGHPIECGPDGKCELDGPSGDRRISCLFVWHTNRKLASAVNYSMLNDDRHEPIEIVLAPAVTLIGYVTNPQGIPIQGVNISPTVDLGKVRCGLGFRAGVTTDSDGRYELKALPAGYSYSISAQCEGFGGNDVSVGMICEPGQTEVKSIILEPANLSISGVVLDDNLRPMANVQVSASGKRQPFRETNTDSYGRFKIDGLCSGSVTLFPSSSDPLWDADADEANGGAEDIELYMKKAEKPRQCMIPPESPPSSLLGKILPDLEELNIDLKEETVKNQKILVCFFELGSPESRAYIRELAVRQEELKQKNTIIVAAQIWPRNEKQFRRWLLKNHVKFPVSTLPDPWKQLPEQRPTYCWGVQNRVPWLILTDSHHVVRAEGFNLEELDDRLEDIGGD